MKDILQSWTYFDNSGDEGCERDAIETLHEYARPDRQALAEKAQRFADWMKKQAAV